MRFLKCIAVSLLVFGSGCAGKWVTPEPSPSSTPIVEVSPSPVPVVSGLSFEPVPGYATTAEQKMIKEAGALAVKTLQSQCFKDFMSKRALIQTNGRTPTQVAEHLQSLTGVVPVSMYYRCMRSWKCPFGTSAVAYRQPPSKTINMNRAVFTPQTPMCVTAGTFLHEGAGHAIGEYDHDYDWNAQRDYSVPYSINKAAEACCR